VNDVSYFMSDGGGLNAPNGTYAFSDGGTFQIVQTVVSPEGCASTSVREVVVNGTLFCAPTAFTPDGDGLNDVWLPVARGMTRYAMMIWNRWGQRIWSTNDPEEPWLGQKQNGSHFVPNDVYHWEVSYLDQLSYPRVHRGTVIVAR
jgi:gliding motility-associated-like protein